MGKHEANGRATRKGQFGRNCLKVAHHAIPHVAGLITLHTIATLILTKSPIALILH